MCNNYGLVVLLYYGFDSDSKTIPSQSIIWRKKKQNCKNHTVVKSKFVFRVMQQVCLDCMLDWRSHKRGILFELAADGSWSARCVAGLSYGSHTVGFTPPATLSRAAISHYNTPALHVHGGSSHAVAVSTIHASQQTLDNKGALQHCSNFL